MDQLSNVLERPKLYYNIDGVGELGIGFMCLAYALLAWFQLHTPPTAIWHRMYTLAIYVAIMVSIIHFGSKAIKNRFTYPRTGFVDYRRRDKYWLPIGIGAAVSVLLSVGVLVAVRQRWEVSTIVPLAIGLVLSTSYARIARSVRWKWAVFAFLVIGVLAIAALPDNALAAFANHTSPVAALSPQTLGAYWLTFVIYGATLIVSGGISFGLYLRHTQAPEQDHQ